MILEVNIKEKKWMEWEMVKVNFIINKGVTMMDNGEIIKCMDLEDYFMQMDT